MITMQKIKQALWSQIFIIYTRYMIGGAFVFASLIKIKGKRFTSDSGESSPIDSAWHFFETLYQSGLYWKFIGFSQLMAGFLLMTQRYAKLGALVNLPIIVNIFIITLSYDFAFTPVITGSMLFANLLLILWDWDQFRVLVNQRQLEDNQFRLEKDRFWQLTGLLMFSITFLYRLFVVRYDLFLWFGSCFLIGLIALIYGLITEKRRKRNL